MADWDADSPRLRKNLSDVLRDARDRAANGNGRTARILANSLLMRYGVPPVVRMRPRPDGGYGRAAEAAMKGDWRPTARAFRRMLGERFI